MRVIKVFLLFVLLTSTTSFAQSTVTPQLRRGIDLHLRGQYLLSSSVILNVMDLPGITAGEKDYANFIYTLNMLELDEREEFSRNIFNYKNIVDVDVQKKFLMLGASQNMISERELSPEQNSRLNLWKNRYEKKLNVHSKVNVELFSNDYLKNVSELQKQLTVNKKDPVKAAIFSTILPGSGQLYCGSFGAAALALVVNGVFGWATYDFYNDQQYGAASAASLVTSITYFGNIMNAYKTAKRINRIDHKAPEEKLERLLLPELIIEELK